MDIEQLPPRKPNFLLIVYLFVATIILIFILALIFMHWDAKHIHILKDHAALVASPTLLPAPAVS
jgi:hypothetical protein